jgi:hypothetical protein
LTEALEGHLRRQVDHSRRFFWQRLRWRVVRSYLPKDSSFSLVDVGAGAGLLGEFLAHDRPSATYQFVEPIGSLRSLLRERHGQKADLGDSTDFGETKFVALLDVLEHQKDDREFLRSLVSKMRPASTLLLTVPALPRLWSQWDEALGHYRRYDKETLLESANGLGLSICEISFLFPELIPLGLYRARKKTDNIGKKDDSEAEFPDLPGSVNDLLVGFGSVSLALRRVWPTGTSLFMAATVE